MKFTKEQIKTAQKMIKQDLIKEHKIRSITEQILTILYCFFLVNVVILAVFKNWIGTILVGFMIILIIVIGSMNDNKLTKLSKELGIKNKK